MIDFNNKGFFKLKQNNEYAERVAALLLDGEEVIDAYKAMRDGVVFTPPIRSSSFSCLIALSAFITTPIVLIFSIISEQG